MTKEIQDKGRVKLIPLTQSQFAIVDEDDFYFLNQWKWYAKLYSGTNSYYAQRGKSTIRMHRLIMGIVDSKILVDHINHNTLDNTRSNLRVCTPSQNCANRKSASNSSSHYLGVSWHEQRHKWRANIMKNRKPIYIGLFKTEAEAAQAYNYKAVELHGEYANLNINL